MASAQVLQLAHPPLWSMDQWPKFASCALGRGAKGGCPFKKLLKALYATAGCASV